MLCSNDQVATLMPNRVMLWQFIYLRINFIEKRKKLSISIVIPICCKFWLTGEKYELQGEPENFSYHLLSFEQPKGMIWVVLLGSTMLRFITTLLFVRPWFFVTPHWLSHTFVCHIFVYLIPYNCLSHRNSVNCLSCTAGTAGCSLSHPTAGWSLQDAIFSTLALMENFIFIIWVGICHTQQLGFSMTAGLYIGYS